MSSWQIADVWETVAEVLPDADALVHGSRRSPWREFDRRADALATFLLARGLDHGGSVALYLYSSPEYLEATFACFKLGIPPVNTNYRYGADELVYLWGNADSHAVVFHGCFVPQVAEIRGRVPGVATWLWVDDGSGPCPPWAAPYGDVIESEAPRAIPPWGRSPDDLCLIYTGGTTGMPKGVMWRHDDLFAVINASAPVRYPEEGNLDDVRHLLVKPGPSFLVAAPLMHGTGFFGALGILGAGGSVITPIERKFSAAAMLDTIDAKRARSTTIVGDAFGRPLVEALDAEPERWDISSLRVITSSGAAWSESNKAALLRHNPSLLLVDTLGSSEAIGAAKSITTSDGSGSGIDGIDRADRADRAEASAVRFEIGADTRVIDEAGVGVVPGSGQAGLLAQRGRGPIGYYKDPVKSSETFRTIDGQRWTITGDYAEVDADGTLRLLGRGSACINTGGEKVYPEEVDEVLKAHPLVADAACVGVPDQRLGQRIVAVVELREPTRAPGDDELIAGVKARLAGYKAPKQIVVVDSIGRAANGKLDYAVLRRWAIEATEAVEVVGAD